MKNQTKTILTILTIGVIFIPKVALAINFGDSIGDKYMPTTNGGLDLDGNTAPQKSMDLGAAADEQKAETAAAAQKMASGQGFKLPLSFLTVTQADKDGNPIAGTTSGTSIFSNNQYKGQSVLTGLILRVIDILVYVLGSVAMLTFIVAGILMIANHGDEAWVTKGKDMMFYSILGVIFALLSFIIVNIVTSLLS